MLLVTSGLPGTWTWCWSQSADGEVQKDCVALIGLGKISLLSSCGGHPRGLLSGAHHSSTWSLLSSSSLALDVEGRRVAIKRGYVPCCAGENPPLTQTFLLQGCTRPAVRRPDTPHASVLGGSKREDKLREGNLSKSGGLPQ